MNRIIDEGYDPTLKAIELIKEFGVDEAWTASFRKWKANKDMVMERFWLMTMNEIERIEDEQQL